MRKSTTDFILTFDRIRRNREPMCIQVERHFRCTSGHETSHDGSSLCLVSIHAIAVTIGGVLFVRRPIQDGGIE